MISYLFAFLFSIPTHLAYQSHFQINTNKQNIESQWLGWFPEQYNGIPLIDKKIILLESFDNNKNKWDSVDDEKETTMIKGGALLMTSKDNTPKSVAISVDFDEENNFEIEANIEFLKGETDNFSGIIWGSDNDKNKRFRFGFSGEGHFLIDKFNSSWINIVNWTVCESFMKKTLNKLTIRKVDDDYFFFINEKLVHRTRFTSLYGKMVGFQCNKNSSIKIDFLKVAIIEEFELFASGIDSSKIDNEIVPFKCEGGKWNYKNSKSKSLLFSECNLNQAYKFYDGLARVQMQKTVNIDEVVEYYAFIDKTGNYTSVRNNEFARASDFVDGKALIIKKMLPDRFQGFQQIDQTGAIIDTFSYIDPDYFRVRNTSNRILFLKDKKYGFMDYNFKPVIPAKFDFAYPFRWGKALVGMKLGLDFQYYFITPKGDLSSILSNDWKVIDKDDKFILIRSKTNKKFGYLNQKGDLTIFLQFDSAKVFDKNRAPVYMNGKKGTIDRTGKFYEDEVVKKKK